MKKFATVFLVCMSVYATLASAKVELTRSRVVELRPNLRTLNNSVFNTGKKYHKSFLPLAQPLELGYFNLETEEISSIRLPTFFTRQSGDPDTIKGISMHFTSPLTRTYLDSVRFVFSLAKIGEFNNNHIKIRVSTAVMNNLYYTDNNGNKVYMPYPQQTGSAKDSVLITNLEDYLTDDPDNPTWYMLDEGGLVVKMNHKNVGKEFFVEILTAFDKENPEFDYQNELYVMGDYFLTEDNFLDFDKQRAVAVPLSGNVLDMIPYDGITNQSRPDPFSSNFFIYAYVTDQVSSVDQNGSSMNYLAQNYPNPLTNESAEIRFSLAKSGYASLKVYNSLGMEVASLVDGFKSEGEQSVSLNASNLPSGTYYYTLKTEGFSQTKALTIAR